MSAGLFGQYFSHLSEKNETEQADNLNFRFCLLEFPAYVIVKLQFIKIVYLPLLVPSISLCSVNFEFP